MTKSTNGSVGCTLVYKRGSKEVPCGTFEPLYTIEKLKTEINSHSHIVENPQRLVVFTATCRVQFLQKA